MFKPLYTAIVLLLTFATTAQSFDLGKVSVAELQEKEYPNDPSAVAAILFSKGETALEYSDNKGFEKVTTVKMRVKIYKKEGYEWANQEVLYYSGSNPKESINFSDVATYNLVDGKIVKTKMKSDGEFDEKASRYWSLKKITLPAVKEGSVVEFEYVLRSERLSTFKKWNFQYAIPVKYSEYKTKVPEYFSYNENQTGVFPIKKTTDARDRTIVSFDKDRYGHGPTQVSQNKSTYRENITIYTGQNIPAMKEEDYVNNIDNYRAKVAHELSFVKFPNQVSENFSTNWETVTKKIYEDDDFGSELKKTGYFEADVDAVIAGLKTQPEIVMALFNHVKAKVKWDNYYGYSCNDGVKTAYKNKTGNVAEINLMLTAMLRYAGVNANPVLLSTRSNGISFFPNRTAFNYVIAAIENPDGIMLLDATEKYALPDVLPLRDLNWLGRLIRKDGTSTEIDLIPKKASKETIFLNANINADGSVTGKVRKQLTDHEALLFRQKNAMTADETYLENLEHSNRNIEVSDYKRENTLELSKPIVENFSFKSTTDVEVINNKIYISPMLFLKMNENPFKQEVREYPVDFGYPVQTKFNISLQVPEGYKIESLPAPASILAGEDIGLFKFFIGANGNTIQLTINSDMNTAILPAGYYATVKEFYQKMVEKENEKIILVKS